MRTRTLSLILFAGTTLMGGCAGPSVYEMVAKEFTTSDISGPHFGVAWYSCCRSPGDPVPPETFETFRSELALCVEELEARREAFRGARSPKPSVAALQLSACLEERNWRLQVLETIPVS